MNQINNKNIKSQRNIVITPLMCYNPVFDTFFDDKSRKG